DTINNPKLKEKDSLMKFDTVVANPPFSLDKWGADNAAGDKYNRFWRGVPPKSKGDWAFITHMVETTYEGTGKVGVVVPHGVLFRGASEGRIRQTMIEENLLEAVIGLPANLFFGTQIPAAILIFNRGKKSNTNVLFIDASKGFETGKNQNKLREQDINKIVETYNDFHNGKLQSGVVEEKYGYVATFEEIKENEFNLNIPRYVDTFVEEDEVDISSVQKEIEELNIKLNKTEEEMKKYIKDLGF
ncbi:MAG: N-6 DNA methylase, partial [Candidatus Gracilibacteria bacterium]|nr:N-6 DNA methylase [Candidatus Gracilibacteria bacterium]